MSWFGKVFSTGIDKTVGTIFKGIDNISTTKEEKAALRSQVLQQVISDRQDARAMYKSDNTLQKIFAIFFLCVWAGLLYLLLNHFVFNEIKLDEWQIAFVNTVWGGVSMKLGTIIDFLFGGSHKDPMRK